MWVMRQTGERWYVGYLTGVEHVSRIFDFPIGEDGKAAAQALVSYLNGGQHPTVNRWKDITTPEQLYNLGKQRDMWEMLCRCGYSYLNDDSYEAVMDAVENFSFFDELVSAIQGLEPVFWTKIQEAIALTKEPTGLKPTMLDSDFDNPKE